MGTTKDLTGETFGHLFVTGDSGNRSSKGEILWTVKCPCGNTRNYRTSKLTNGERKTCGCGLKDSKGDPIHSKLDCNYKTKIKRRNSKRFFSKLKRQEQLLIIDEYTNGSNVNKLSDTYSVEPASLRDAIRDHRDKLNSTYELNYLINTQKTSVAPSTIDKALASQFTEPLLEPLMSPSSSETLTNEEMLYAWFFVNTGSNETALKEAGFTKCLKVKDSVRKNLLGIFLREKANVAKYIMTLQEKRVEDIAVSKNLVQSELILQVTQLKEITSLEGASPQQRTQLLRALELLGKSIGAFSENIKVENIDTSSAIDLLVAKASEEIEAGEYTIEDIDEPPEE